MAKTQRDIALHDRIINLINQLKGTDKEIIEQISGICGICFKTASEHYRGYKAQKNFKESEFKEICGHNWSNAFSTPGGLMRECLLCHETQEVKI
jgi:hypothetical protein